MDKSRISYVRIGPTGTYSQLISVYVSFDASVALNVLEQGTWAVTAQGAIELFDEIPVLDRTSIVSFEAVSPPFGQPFIDALDSILAVGADDDLTTVARSSLASANHGSELGAAVGLLLIDAKRARLGKEAKLGIGKVDTVASFRPWFAVVEARTVTVDEDVPRIRDLADVTVIISRLKHCEKSLGLMTVQKSPVKDVKKRFWGRRWR